MGPFLFNYLFFAIYCTSIKSARLPQLVLSDVGSSPWWWEGLSKPCSLRQSAAILRVSSVWRFNVTDRQLLRGGISAENQMSYVCACTYRSFVFSVSFFYASSFRVFCLERFSFPPTPSFFFLHENIPIMCQSNTTQRIQPQLSSSASSEVLAVCGVNNTVWCALEETIWPKVRRETYLGQFYYSQSCNPAALNLWKNENPSFFISKVLRIRK